MIIAVIHIDRSLWIATYTGLTRFDGQHFTRVAFPKLVVSVHSMAEGPDGDLWLGTRAGVFRISPRILEQPGDPRVTFYHLGPGGDDAVWQVRFGRDGTLWAGTAQGLYRWNGGSDFSPVVSGLAVIHFEEAPNGHILMPSPKGYMEWDGARTVDHPEVAQQLGTRPYQMFQVFPDRQGALWFSTARGLFRQSGASAIYNGSATNSGSVTNIGGRGKAAYETYQDTDGNYWIWADGGVFRVRGNTLETVAADVQCRALFADRDGGLWIGTNGDGLIHIQDRAVHMFTTADGLRSQNRQEREGCRRRFFRSASYVRLAWEYSGIAERPGACCDLVRRRDCPGRGGVARLGRGCRIVKVGPLVFVSHEPRKRVNRSSSGEMYGSGCGPERSGWSAWDTENHTRKQDQEPTDRQVSI